MRLSPQKILRGKMNWLNSGVVPRSDYCRWTCGRIQKMYKLLHSEAEAATWSSSDLAWNRDGNEMRWMRTLDHKFTNRDCFNTLTGRYSFVPLDRAAFHPGCLYCSHLIMIETNLRMTCHGCSIRLCQSTIKMPWPATKNSGRSILQQWHFEFQNTMAAAIQFYMTKQIDWADFS